MPKNYIQPPESVGLFAPKEYIILLKFREFANNSNPNKNKQIKSFIRRLDDYVFHYRNFGGLFNGNIHNNFRHNDNIIKKILGPDFQTSAAVLLQSKFLEAVAMRNTKLVTELLQSASIEDLYTGFKWSIQHSIVDIFIILLDHLGTGTLNKKQLLWTNHKFIQLLIHCSVSGEGNPTPTELLEHPDLTLQIKQMLMIKVTGIPPEIGCQIMLMVYENCTPKSKLSSSHTMKLLYRCIELLN